MSNNRVLLMRVKARATQTRRVRLNRRHRRTAATQSAVSRARLCAKACCRSFRGTRAALCAGTSGIAWSHGTYCARTGKVLSPRAPAATVCYQ